MYANAAINEADLVIALGVRFDDRVTGSVNKFISQGKIIHIDIDRDELNKNKNRYLADLFGPKVCIESDIGCRGT